MILGPLALIFSFFDWKCGVFFFLGTSGSIAAGKDSHGDSLDGDDSIGAHSEDDLWTSLSSPSSHSVTLVRPVCWKCV